MYIFAFQCQFYLSSFVITVTSETWCSCCLLRMNPRPNAHLTNKHLDSIRKEIKTDRPGGPDIILVHCGGVKTSGRGGHQARDHCSRCRFNIHEHEMPAYFFDGDIGTFLKQCLRWKMTFFFLQQRINQRWQTQPLSTSEKQKSLRCHGYEGKTKQQVVVLAGGVIPTSMRSGGMSCSPSIWTRGIRLSIMLCKSSKDCWCAGKEHQHILRTCLLLFKLIESSIEYSSSLTCSHQGTLRDRMSDTHVNINDKPPCRLT